MCVLRLSVAERNVIWALEVCCSFMPVFPMSCVNCVPLLTLMLLVSSGVLLCVCLVPMFHRWAVQQVQKALAPYTEGGGSSSGHH